MKMIKKIKKARRDKYRNLSDEDKKKKREYGKNRYHSMSEEEKIKKENMGKTDTIICLKKKTKN